MNILLIKLKDFRKNKKALIFSIITFSLLINFYLYFVNFNLQKDLQTLTPATVNNNSDYPLKSSNDLYKCEIDKSEVTGNDRYSCKGTHNSNITFTADMENYEPIKNGGNCNLKECLFNSSYYGLEGFTKLSGYYTKYSYNDDYVSGWNKHLMQYGGKLLEDKDYICGAFVIKEVNNFYSDHISNQIETKEINEYGTFENKSPGNTSIIINLTSDLNTTEKELLFNSSESNIVEVSIVLNTPPQHGTGPCYSNAGVVSVQTTD